eukprot:SAG11_NODE_599_length_8269_cov_3.455080_5_plen_135_part_00
MSTLLVAPMVATLTLPILATFAHDSVVPDANFGKPWFSAKDMRNGSSLSSGALSLTVDDERFATVRRALTQEIQARTFPGCVALVSVGGKLLFHEAFGELVYAGDPPPVRSAPKSQCLARLLLSLVPRIIDLGT